MSDLPAGPGRQEGSWLLRGLFLERQEAPGTHPEDTDAGGNSLGAHPTMRTLGLASDTMESLL